MRTPLEIFDNKSQQNNNSHTQTRVNTGVPHPESTYILLDIEGCQIRVGQRLSHTDALVGIERQHAFNEVERLCIGLDWTLGKELVQRNGRLLGQRHDVLRIIQRSSQNTDESVQSPESSLASHAAQCVLMLPPSRA